MKRKTLTCRALMVGLLRVAVFALMSAEGSFLAAQDEHPPYYTKAGGPAGVGRYEPGTWAAVGVQLANPAEAPIEVLSVMSFQQEQDLQFGRRIWLPPRSRRLTWYPVRVPETPPTQGRVWQVQSLLFEGGDESETPIPAMHGQMRVENLLPMGRGKTLTGLIADPEDEYELTQMLWAARLSRNDSKSFTLMDREQFPPSVESLDAVEELVVASDELMTDAAACAAVRQWLHRGGSLWLMLDQVDPAAARQLLGDALPASLIDRVERQRFQVFSHDSRGTQPCGDERTFDDPVAFVRAIFTDFRASHTVDDWPVAAWRNVGRGKLLVTTLSPRAWLRPRTAMDQLASSPDDPTEGVHFVATEPLGEVAFEFFTEAEPPPLQPEQFAQVVSEQIGYRIVSRGRVAALLGTFCVALIAVGVWLFKRERLEHLGWIGPLGVMITSFSLLGVGRASREAVPETVAVTQFAETSPDSSEIPVSGLLALYSSDKTDESLRADFGGIFWPPATDREGTVVRMISTDRDRWQLQNLILPAGQQLVPFATSYRADHPVQATATFGANGLEGTLESGPFEQLADAVLALPSTRNMSAELLEQTRFTSDADSVLAPEQFLSGTVLSDEQRRRREIYRMLFTREDKQVPYPDKPTLLAWASPLDLGFQLLDDAEYTGSVLVSIPLTFTSPPPETHVVIPGPFVPYRAVGATTSATFDDRSRRWSGPFSQGLDTTLRFQLPREVLPLQVEAATLTVEIKAPSRELTITGLAGGEEVVLESERSPLGRREFTLAREDVLQPDDQGVLTLGINVSDARDDESNQPLDPSEAQMWQIEDVQLEVTGVTQSP